MFLAMVREYYQELAVDEQAVRPSRADVGQIEYP